MKVIVLNENGTLTEQNVKLTSLQKKKEYKQIITPGFCKKITNQTTKVSVKYKNTDAIQYHNDKIIYYGISQKIDEFKKNNHEFLNSLTNSFYGKCFVVKVNATQQLTDFSVDEYETLFNKFQNGFSINKADSEIEESEIEESEEEEEFENYHESSSYETEIDEPEESDCEENIIDYGDIDEQVEEEDTTKNDDFLTEQTEEDFEEVLITCNKTTLEETEESKKLREKCLHILGNILSKEQSILLEKSIVEYTINTCKQKRIPCKWTNTTFKKRYINKVRSLFTNLKDDSYVKNTNFIKRITDENIDITQLPSMSFQEIFPEHWKKMMDEKYKKEKILYEEKQEAMTDQYKCGRCKSRKCTYYELQTRSADESMTIFITCINCGNRWKQ